VIAASIRWDRRSVDPRRDGSSSSRERIPDKNRRPERREERSQQGRLQRPDRLAGARLCNSDGIAPTRRKFAHGSRILWIQLAGGVGFQVTEAAGVSRASDGAGPDWWPERRCGILPSLCASLLPAVGSRVRLSAFEENWSQSRCTGSHPERMRPHHWPISRRLLSCSERKLEAPGSGKTSRAMTAKSADLAPAAQFSPTPTDTHLICTQFSRQWCGR